jgi:hypothetical protein
MKKMLLILVVLIGFGITANAQDVITLKNGTDINALVQKISEFEIEYKKFDNPNGPNYTLKKSEILIIRYANGSKDIFSEEEKPVDVKNTSTPKSDNRSNELVDNRNNELIRIPANEQSRKDVIVYSNTSGGINVGVQTKITHINDKYIYYMLYKRTGKEKEKKIKQKYVEFTLTFDENAKKEKYPEQMSARDFSSLPIYFGCRWPLYDPNFPWIVFGTEKMSNLSLVEKTSPDILKYYKTGKVAHGAASGFSTAALCTLPLIIVPLILDMVALGHMAARSKAFKNAFLSYYETYVDLEVCAKYGIVITPYSTSIHFK